MDKGKKTKTVKEIKVETKKCVGCRACVEACPYGAPQFDEAKGFSSKCDLCSDLLDKGQEPACVSSCMMRVLKVGWLDETVDMEEPRGRGLPDPSGVRPSLRVTPHRHGGIPQEPSR